MLHFFLMYVLKIGMLSLGEKFSLSPVSQMGYVCCISHSFTGVI